MTSDYTPPNLVKPTKGGSAGDGSLAGALTVQADGSGSTNVKLLTVGSEYGTPTGIGGVLNLKDGYTPTIEHVPGGNISIDDSNTCGVLLNGSTAVFNNGKLTKYNNNLTAGLGLSMIGATAFRAALGTSSANLASYTPGGPSSFRVVWRLSAKAATTPTLTLTYTDPDAGAQTITLYDTAMSADTVAQGQFALVSAASDAITVSGSALAASDILATVEIIQSQ